MQEVLTNPTGETFIESNEVTIIDEGLNFIHGDYTPVSFKWLLNSSNSMKLTLST